MFKFTSTMKGLMALALGTFALGASAALPELSTDDAPKYYFIKNLRAAGQNANTAYVNAIGVGQFTHGTVTSTQTLYEPANALWYFVKAGEKKTITFSDGTTSREVTPVYIKNLTKPGLTYNVFGKQQFTETGTPYYLFEHSFDGVSGVVIMKTSTAGVAAANDSPDLGATDLCWGDFKNSASTAITYWSANDSGAMFEFVLADENKISGTKTNYLSGVKDELSNTIKLFESIMGGSELSSTIKSEIDAIGAIEDVPAVEAEILAEIYPKLDRKVVYMISNNRTEEQGKYIYLNKTTSKFVATNHKCVLGKWQLIHNGSGNNFILRNIATDTYLSAQGGSAATSSTVRRNSPFYFELLPHKDGKGFVLHFLGNSDKMCEKIDTDANSNIDCIGVPDPSYVTDSKFSFSFEAANIAASDITADGLYVIRSTRGKTNEDSYKYTAKYPGSLITAYPADRQLARERVRYRNGAHLEMYAPGSVWKFVKEGEGYKIYSLIGEQTKAAENKGLKVVEHDGVKYVDVEANPDVFYLKEVSNADGAFMAANTYALCTAKDGGEYVTVTDENNHGDFFLKLSSTAPTTATDDAASFFIESIGEVHEGVNPSDEYIHYAADLHMFKSIEPVLDAEDMEYILAEKGSYKDNLSSITSIAQANEFMALGKMTASSRAFQRLNGKMVRFVNRMSNFVYNGKTLDPGARYFYANSAYSGNPVAVVKGLADQALASVWVVELPESTEVAVEGDNTGTPTDAAARMRQLRLRNLATGGYIKADLKTGDVAAAQTLTVRRRPSLDQSEFFLALTKGYDRNTALMMADNGADNPQASENTTWGANSTAYAHWSIESAVSTVAPTVTLTKHSEKDDTYVLTVVKPAGVTAMSLTGIASIGAVTVEKATTARELTEATEVTLTADGEGNITGEIAAQLASATEANTYTVKLPAALLAMDNNVSPAVEATVTVPQDPSLTGIREINAAEKGADVIYDLQGRRVSKAGKGVYIINGVKTLVK